MHDAETIYGLHAVEAALHAGSRVTVLFVQEGRRDARMERLLQAAAAAGAAVRTLARHELDRMVPGARHQGVVAQCRAAAALGEDELESWVATLPEPFLLVLDGVQDPHNLGACLRTADAAGVHGVIAPRDRAAGLTATARKVASGAAEALPFFQVTNLARTLRRLQEQRIWIVGAAGEAETDHYAADLRGPLALVLGAEGKGMRRLTREHCDSLVRIPMAGTVSSLNVSVATGVLLFEAVRQRGAERSNETTKTKD
jgi:23S rRNA (guanosine2251-2'-O)-methyltransferase